MAEIKWIKLSVNMFDDEKIKLIRTMPEGDTIALIWVQILCLAGKINDGGWVYMGQNLAYSDEMLAAILNHPLNVMRIALQTLEQFGMIDITSDGKIDVLNWEKHQSTDKMNRIANQNRERQQKHYYRTRLRDLGVGVDAKGFTENLEELKQMYESMTDEPNVRLTLANATEVRSKKLDVRSKKEEVNNTDNKLSEKQLQENFNAIWKSYPNKKGKPKAFTSYKKAIKDGVTDEQIIQGLNNYLKEIEIKQTDKQYIKHGSTWFNNYGWEDDYITTQSPKPQTNYRRSSNHVEITPSWSKEQTIPYHREEVPTEESAAKEQELRQRMKEMGLE